MRTQRGLLNIFRSLWIGISLMLAPAFCLSSSIDEHRVNTVQFKHGTEGTSVQDKIKGRGYVDYLLRAKAGQKMTVTLNADNRFAFFNVMPPGTDVAIFVGSTSGNKFEGILHADGEYRVRVYLMRVAARRGEEASYTLDVHIPSGVTADYADGLFGGPDYWEVANLEAGKVLELVANPSPYEGSIEQFGNGTLLKNYGCTLLQGVRWCKVKRKEDNSVQGWVLGQYLIEH